MAFVCRWLCGTGRAAGCVVLAVACLSPARADDSAQVSAAPALFPEIVAPLALQPAEIKLTALRYPHSVLVSGTTADGRTVDVTAHASFTSADANVARVDAQGWIHPVASGTTTVAVTIAGQSAVLPVMVDLPAGGGHPYSFRHDVMPALSKSGCNSGACHGYSLGKRGFKLSLRGGDEAADYPSIAQEFLGRRINVNRPEQSLLLTKPLGDVPHGGGVRMERGSLVHESLAGWIAEGARSDLGEPLHVVSVAVFPKQVVTQPGSPQQLQVVATYSDGRTRDVTRLAIYTSNDERVAEVDGEGLVTPAATGETAVLVRFERLFDVSTTVVLGDTDAFVPTEVPTDNLVDQHVLAKLNAVRIAPSELAGDAEFLRRVYLDLIGLQPKADEVRAFLADSRPDKRAAVVEALFARPEFVDHWSLKWGDLLQNNRAAMSDEQMWAFREWIRAAVASNMPLDEFARRIVTAEGSYRDDPAAAYYLVSVDANDTLQRLTQVFCGVRMLCAKCHAHPFENWTQADYYGLAGFFNQVTAKQDPARPDNPKAKVVLLNTAAGYAVHPRTGAAQPPRFLGGMEPALDAAADRREAYAAWLTSPENRFFARSLANRIWSYFFHRGIIEPVDDLRQTNPPVNAALLDALTADFVAHGFDARHLMRTIVASRTYQRSAVPNESNARDEINFARALPRRLPAEALLDSLVQATGVPEPFAGAPDGFTAAQLPDAAIDSEFLSLFGKPKRAEACECERNDDSNLLQALAFINGPSILARVANPTGRVAALAGQSLADEQLVEELYLWAIARPPTAEERALALAHLQAYGPQRAEAAQDLMWVLLSGKEFMFNY